jgi:hypothetical protein
VISWFQAFAFKCKWYHYNKESKEQSENTLEKRCERWREMQTNKSTSNSASLQSFSDNLTFEGPSDEEGSDHAHAYGTPASTTTGTIHIENNNATLPGLLEEACPCADWMVGLYE